MAERTEQLRGNLARIHTAIEQAATAAGRSTDEITLVVVTKNFGADDVRRLADLGVTDVGENRDQEAKAKYTECRELDLRWHFVGQLQTNKAKSVVTYADLIHTIDRPGLVRAVDLAAARRDKQQDVLVQVNLNSEPGRGGVVPADLGPLLQSLAEAVNVTVRGVMAVAPLDWDPHKAFDELAEIGAVVQSQWPSANWISAGMSGDFVQAIAHGATHLRIGTAVLGGRENVR